MKGWPLVLLLACGSESSTDSALLSTKTPGGGAAETGAVDTGADFCEGTPAVTYANFGQSFMTHHCQGCHASTVENRYGAPESVTFDSVDQVWALKSRVLIRSTGETPDMPPMGGPSADDRTRLEWWLRCAESGT